MPVGKAEAVDLMNRVSPPRRAIEDHTGVSGPSSVTPRRWRILAGLFAKQWRMAWSKVSGASWQLGQVGRAVSSHDGWPRR